MINFGKFSAQMSPRLRWGRFIFVRYPINWPVKWVVNAYLVQVWLYRVVPEVRAAMDPE